MQFKTAPTVKTGDTISSVSHNALALSFNQRILAGAGDAAWRIIWNAHSLMRQVRNPQDTGVAGAQIWPASDEWWKMYALINNTTKCGDATSTTLFWPIEGLLPGTGGGANVANPMMTFVFGRDTGYTATNALRAYEGEAARLTDGPSEVTATWEPIDVAGLNGDKNIDTKNTWAQAKLQRGWIETEGWRASAPAYEAAHSVYGWRYGSTAPYLSTYASFIPVAKSEGLCAEDNGQADFMPVIKWQAKFTALLPGLPSYTFDTCPGVGGSLQYIDRLTDRYVLYIQGQGYPIILPYTHYIEGPYGGGGVLAKSHSELLTQALNKFVLEMRGSWDERRNNCAYQAEKYAFDFQRFLSTQYALAPAAGGVYNEETGDVTACPVGYPKYQLKFNRSGNTGAADTQTPLTPLPYPSSGTDILFTLTNTPPRVGDTAYEHFIADQCVFSAVYIESFNVTSTDTKIELLDELGWPIYLGDISDPCVAAPAVNSNSFSILIPESHKRAIRYRVLFLPVSATPGSVRVRLKTPVSFYGESPDKPAEDGYINVEILEQIAYIPDVQDAYAVLRCGLTTGEGARPDPIGGIIDGNTVREYSAKYFNYGCIFTNSAFVNIHQHETAVNYNAIYESARQLIKDNMRMVARTMLTRYKVAADEKSVIYFNRYTHGGGSDSSGIQTTETEVKPNEREVKVPTLTVKELKPFLEYVVKKKGYDNIKPKLVSGSGNSRYTTELPVSSYQVNKVVGGLSVSTIFCDDYVLYANVKYVPPGYNTALSTEYTRHRPDQYLDYPTDRVNNYHHVIVGLPPAPSVVSVPAGYFVLSINTEVKLYFDNTCTRTVNYYDNLGVLRAQVINSAKIYWQSRSKTGRTTGNGGGGYDYPWINVTQHRNNDDPTSGVVTSDRYNNGFRYQVQKSIDGGVSWVTICNGAATDKATKAYGFEPSFILPVVPPALSTSEGWYYFEDVAAYGKTLGTEVQYRILAKPVLDFNNSEMEVYQRAYFTPLRMTWETVAGGKYRIMRRVQKYGMPEGTSPGVNFDTTDISGPITVTGASYTFTDFPTSICPVRLIITNEDINPTTTPYFTYDILLGYELHKEEIGQTGGLEYVYKGYKTVANLRVSPQSQPTFMVCPTSINPTGANELYGTPSLVYANNGADCFGIQYRVYGPTTGGDSGISYKNPSDPTEVYSGSVFDWVKNYLAAGSYNSLSYIWQPDGGASAPAITGQFAQIYQYNRYCGTGGSELCIENTAGCDPGNFTGVFAHTNQTYMVFRNIVKTNEAYHSEDGIDLARTNTIAGWGIPYATAFKSTQWTPWTQGGSFDGATCNWYILRTGYEQLYMQSLSVVAAGSYTVRGQGYITYDNKKYFSGEKVYINVAPNENKGLAYSVSDSSMKLVVVTSVVCNNDNFDAFSGIVPDKNLSEADLRVGVSYLVFRGNGITFKRGGKLTEILPKGRGANTGLFTRLAGDGIITYIQPGTASQIRAVDGIIQQASVPALGMSNEWCMFMSFNHYHWSPTSIWKVENYGDVMPFLHNRCHTMSGEIRGPGHTSLVDQFAYGNESPVVSEAPPGYTYLEGINVPSGTDEEIENYFRSCPIYKLPYEIESAKIVYTEVAGTTEGNTNYFDGTVELTLKKRIQHTDDADSIIDSPAYDVQTVGGYNVSTDAAGRMRQESYRTDENGLRDYLLKVNTYVDNVTADTTAHCIQGRIGDSSASFDVFSGLNDNPFGCCDPRFYFVKLIPYVYEDPIPNTTVETDKDTLIFVDPYVQMDLYLRSMCGGWLDLTSLQDVNCDTALANSPIADYTYENLCYQACKSAGTYLDVIPDLLTGTGRWFLPVRTIAQYNFTFADPAPTDPLVLQYRVWDLASCAYGAWQTLQGQFTYGLRVPIGGSGYKQPEISFTNETFVNETEGWHTHAQAVAILGVPVEITDFLVLEMGENYIQDDVVVTFAGGDMAEAAAATVTVVAGKIIAVAVDPDHQGVYAYTPTVIISATAGGAGAQVKALTAPIDKGGHAISSIVITNPGAGYSAVPDVVITDAGTPAGLGAYAVAKMKVVAGELVAIDITPLPSGSLDSISIPFEGATSGKVAFKFTYASSWVGGVLMSGAPVGPVHTATLVPNLLFYFLPNNIAYPHLYDIYRFEHTQAGGVCSFPSLLAGGADSGWVKLTIAPEPGPECEVNLVHTEYDGCKEECSCLWVDPVAFGSPPVSVGLSYVINDTTEPTPGDEQLYYLDWTAVPGVTYNLERKLFYASGRRVWEVIASGITPPYIDDNSWQTSFTRQLVVTKTNTMTQVAEQLFVPISPATTIPSTSAREMTDIGVGYTYKNVYMRCVITVGTGSSAVNYTLPVLRLTTTATQLISYIDNRIYPGWDIKGVTQFKYTFSVVSGVTLSWPVIEEHNLLVGNTEKPGGVQNLVYTVYQTSEILSLNSPSVTREVMESASTGSFVLSSTETRISQSWSGFPEIQNSMHGLDDQRNNELAVPYLNTEKYYVVATWTDNLTKETPVYTTPCGTTTSATENIDRVYRVEATSSFKSRWFTAMPAVINTARPQGFSPIPNTCTYAEMFNNFANAINKLTHVRMELPFTFQQRIVSGVTPIPDGYVQVSGGGQCYRSVTYADPGTTGALDWASTTLASRLTGIAASVAVVPWIPAGAIDQLDSAEVSIMQGYDIRMNPEDICTAAIPEELLANFSVNDVAIIGKKDEDFYHAGSMTHGPLAYALCCDTAGTDVTCLGMVYDDQPVAGQYVNFVSKTSFTEGECGAFMAGEVRASDPGGGISAWLRGQVTTECGFPGASATMAVESLRALPYMKFSLY